MGASAGRQLCTAVNNGDASTVETMLKSDPSLIHWNEWGGGTLLMLACTQGSVKVVEILLRYKPDLYAKNFAGNTAEFLAYQYSHKDVVALLKSYTKQQQTIAEEEEKKKRDEEERMRVEVERRRQIFEEYQAQRRVEEEKKRAQEAQMKKEEEERRRKQFEEYQAQRRVEEEKKRVQAAQMRKEEEERKRKQLEEYNKDLAQRQAIRKEQQRKVAEQQKMNVLDFVKAQRLKQSDEEWEENPADEIIASIAVTTKKTPTPNARQSYHHFIRRCMAEFTCPECSRWWTSAQVNSELSWLDNKEKFWVKIYGQQCVFCRDSFLPPDCVYNTDLLIKKFCEVLTTYDTRVRCYDSEEEEEAEGPPHKQELCELCQEKGSPCWKSRN